MVEVQKVFERLEGSSKLTENAIAKRLSHLAFPNSRTDKWETILHLISSSRSSKGAMIAEMAITMGARPNARNYNWDTPSHIVAQNNNFEVFRVLRNAGADFFAKNKDGKTPIDIANDNGFTDLAMAMQDAMLLKQLKRPYTELIVVGGKKLK